MYQLTLEELNRRFKMQYPTGSITQVDNTIYNLTHRTNEKTYQFKANNIWMLALQLNLIIAYDKLMLKKIAISNLPKGSIITYIKLKEKYSSLFALVGYKTTEEYKKEHELLYDNRILQIRLIKGEQDLSKLSITSYAATS